MLGAIPPKSSFWCKFGAGSLRRPVRLENLNLGRGEAAVLAALGNRATESRNPVDMLALAR
jgi:hypothetical protein